LDCNFTQTTGLSVRHARLFRNEQPKAVTWQKSKNN
jgi:hypothetical protein